jgi:hypothetical protein
VAGVSGENLGALLNHHSDHGYPRGSQWTKWTLWTTWTLWTISGRGSPASTLSAVSTSSTVNRADKRHGHGTPTAR